MTWWAVGSAAVSVVGGIMGSNASKSAANAQSKSAQASFDEQRREYDQSRADFAPYRQSGQNALGSLNKLQSGNMSGFFTSPDYNFRRTEGTRGINNSFAARGGAASGNALRALTDYSSNLASGEFANYWNRLKGLSDQGLGATGQTTQAGENMANNNSNALMAQGDARASGIMGSANSWNNSLNSGLNSYLLYKGGYFGGGGKPSGGANPAYNASGVYG